MGRTIPSFRLATDIEWKQWKIYQKYLDKKKNNDNNEQKLFKEMFFISRLYNSACSYATIPIRIYPILISITFHQYKYFFFKKGVKMIKKKMNGSNNNSITSLFPYQDILTKEIETWKGYSDCLRKKDRELFEQMLKNCYKYSSSITAKGEDYSTESLLMSLLFEQYKNNHHLLIGQCQKLARSCIGWIFDTYYHPDRNKIVFWLKDIKNNIFKVEDTKWNNYFYIASDDDISNLQRILVEDNNNNNSKKIGNFIKKIEFVYKYEKITDQEKSKVLKLYTSCTLGSNNTKFANLIDKRIGRIKAFGIVRLYNVDILPIQHYFFDYDIFPCATYKIENTSYGLYWNLVDKKNDGIENTNYHVPTFKIIYLKINFEKGTIPRFSDKLKSITIIVLNSKKEEKIDIQQTGVEEEEVILQLSSIIKRLDPDIIITENGDSFLFPYLIYRATANDLNLVLSRDTTIPLRRQTKKGTSYFSYGKTYYKPSSIRLYGRLHIDISTSFLWRETQDIHGLVEISRLSRLPLHEVSRATIGKCLTSLHLYNATKKDILVPWKPVISEHLKSLRELFIADKGGIILEPEIGLHEKVAEFDFVSLYPNIIYQKNISAETILCKCCCSNNDIIVPELNYHICKSKKGLVPESLEMVLRKRLQYKNLKSTTTNPTLKKIYDSRQSALKWILVTSFGYLGFSNAKFGRIDAHIAVCAFARDVLLKSKKIAEEQEFEVLHGLVDSIWVKKDNAVVTINDYIQLKENIERKTGFEISFEGIYKWIVFLPSELDNRIPVPNRYFGVFEDGTLKIRGIDTRRHDTPVYFSNFQQELLETLATANNKKELKERIPEINFIYKKYISSLRERQVPVTDLIFTKQLSKNYNEYENRNTVENNAIKILASEKEYLKAGQLLKYVIVDYKRRKAIPYQLINDKTLYDVERYSELLTEIYDLIIKIVK